MHKRREESLAQYGMTLPIPSLATKGKLHQQLLLSKKVNPFRALESPLAPQM
jgi:hypothetical protein